MSFPGISSRQIDSLPSGLHDIIDTSTLRKLPKSVLFDRADYCWRS